MARSRVVLATGDEWICNLIGAVLREVGFEVATAPTGAAALELLDQGPTDVVLIDAALPDEPYVLIEQLRQGPAAPAPVLLLAHADDSFSRMEALRSGADFCITKPFRADELCFQVLAVLAMARRCAAAPHAFGDAPSAADLRAPPASSSPSAALEGDLAQVSLATVLSLLELERRTGVMVIQGPKQGATLAMREGAAARATLGGATSSIIGVLRRVLRWKSGRFEFRPDDGLPASMPPNQHSIGALLIEAARLDDETPSSRRSESLLPPPSEEIDLSFDVHEAPTSPGSPRRASVRPSAAPPARSSVSPPPRRSVAPQAPAPAPRRASPASIPPRAAPPSIPPPPRRVGSRSSIAPPPAAEPVGRSKPPPPPEPAREPSQQSGIRPLPTTNSTAPPRPAPKPAGPPRPRGSR